MLTAPKTHLRPAFWHRAHAWPLVATHFIWSISSVTYPSISSDPSSGGPLGQPTFKRRQLIHEVLAKVPTRLLLTRGFSIVQHFDISPVRESRESQTDDWQCVQPPLLFYSYPRLIFVDARMQDANSRLNKQRASNIARVSSTRPLPITQRIHLSHAEQHTSTRFGRGVAGR
jgi:hypothetical protein